MVVFQRFRPIAAAGIAAASFETAPATAASSASIVTIGAPISIATASAP